MENKVEKRVVLAFRKGDLTEDKTYECPVYISVNGAIKFVDSFMFKKDELIKLLDKHNTNGPTVVDYDEVLNG